MKTQALYEERYALITPVDGPLAGRDSVTWREAAGLPLALLTPDMQNPAASSTARLASAGVRAEPKLQSDSMVALLPASAPGRGAPSCQCASHASLGRALRSNPLSEPEIVQTIGLHRPPSRPDDADRRGADAESKTGVSREHADGAGGEGWVRVV